MIPALILVPLLAGLAAFLIRPPWPRRALLLAAAALHTGLVGVVWSSWPAPPAPWLDGWLALDAPGLLFLSIASILFLAASIYGVAYLQREGGSTPREDMFDRERGLFVNEPEAVFVGCLLLFLACMSAVTVCQHFGLLWVAIEATTVVTAPLIYFHRHHRSLEATWKYLLICSVGIALALPGNFSLAAATAGVPGGEGIGLVVGELIKVAPELNVTWLKAAFIFLVIGYGTKMGLAPLHTWLPDAHSEAPSLVSALLSGALLNCAFLGILRIHRVCVAAGLEAFSQQILLGFGLVSLAVAAIFIVGQGDFKRLLAYSSVEHMGILALGVGLGGIGTYGTALHALGHSFTKAALFLVAGNILASYRTRSCAQIHGMAQAMPYSGALWLAGFLAITGAPPFAIFASEFTILRAALDGGPLVVAGVYLVLLAVIFLGMAALFLPMLQGPAPVGAEEATVTAPSVPGPPGSGRLWLTLPSLVLLLLVLLLGLYVPPAVRGVLNNVAVELGGRGDECRDTAGAE